MERYKIPPLRAALLEVLKKHGVAPEHAEALVDCLITADASGVHSHGLSVFATYLKKIKKGGFDLHTSHAVLKETAAFALIDAKNAIGAVSARKCMELAIEKSSQSGVYTVFSRNANTFGPAFYYSKMAVERGMIGICFSNSPSAMPAWGGTQKILGTNPFSIGIPSGKNGPILIDMATSVVAKSKINEIRKAGGRIPEGWALDENGQPTTDPVAAIRGMVLPMAAHKGYAIAMAIDIIAGVLSGAAYLNHINRFYSEDHKCMNVGQCFVAMDPTMIFSENFYAEVDNYIEELHASGEKVLFPGERERESRKYAEKHGVVLLKETVSNLETIFFENRIPNGLVGNG